MTDIATTTWAEWKRITRFLGSTRLSRQRERAIWGLLELSAPEGVVLRTPAGQGEYKVSLAGHLEAVVDDTTLHAAVLIQTYALTELAACDVLQVDSRALGGIEDWGKRLLDAEGNSWTDVKSGRSGIVEVAVLRNAFAHGSRRIDEGASRRLAAASAPARAAGSTVHLPYDDLVEYRARLKSLLRLGGVRPPQGSGADQDEVDET